MPLSKLKSFWLGRFLVFNKAELLLRPARNLVSSSHLKKISASSVSTPETNVLRYYEAQQNFRKENTTICTLYVLSAFVFFIGGTYAFVPVYKLVCQQTGIVGSLKRKVEKKNWFVYYKKTSVKL
jgi:hypothetical protein